MAKQIHSSITAVAYARSLLELATERNQAVPIGEELEGLRQVVEGSPTFKDFIADPGIAESERSAAITRIFRGRLSELLMNFLGVLERHGRLRLIPEIENSYAELLDEQLGNVEVDVTAATGLSPDQVEQVRQQREPGDRQECGRPPVCERRDPGRAGVAQCTTGSSTAASAISSRQSANSS